LSHKLRQSSVGIGSALCPRRLIQRGNPGDHTRAATCSAGRTGQAAEPATRVIPVKFPLRTQARINVRHWPPHRFLSWAESHRPSSSTTWRHHVSPLMVSTVCGRLC